MVGWKEFLGLKPSNGKGDAAVKTGRLSQVISNSMSVLSPFRSRTSNALEKLRLISDETDALLFLRKVNPDVSMAVWNFIRLSNQGHEMQFEGIAGRNKGRRLPKVEQRWRETVAARVNALSNSGLDGLIDQLHFSAFMRAAQAVEVEVADTLDDIVDVYPVIPQTVEWKLEDRGGRKVWAPYQVQKTGRVDLSEANFFWVPTDPDIDDPRGNLVMGSVLQAIDFQMQVLQDMQAVIHNQGWPRYDIELLLERVVKSIPPAVKTDPQKQKEWLEARVQEIRNAFSSLKPDDTFVHFDDVKVGKAQGGEVTRSVDIRAMFDGIDQQLMAGAKQMSIFMNRNSGVTESWGSVQFRIFVSGIASIQRGSKRLIEEVARLWLRTQGIQARPKFTHNTIDWESEAAKANVKLLWQQYYAIGQLMGWIDGPTAASGAMGVSSAAGEPVPDAVRINFDIGGGRSADGDGPGDGTAPPGRHGSETDGTRQGRVLRVFGGRGTERGGDRD